ncbi:peptidase M14 [Bacillus sp. RO3]|nr:peptidase M14 [Bacillus sp. RO3]
MKMTKRSLPVILAATFLVAPSVQAETPYYGKTYSQPDQVRPLYPELPITDNTPAFSREGDAFTSQEEMLAYIQQLEAKSPYLTVKSIGTSQEGRSIPALYFTKDKRISPGLLSKKPIVWMQSQIHGNEPASGEAVLAIANRLTGEWGEDMLDDINVIVIPRINPDGSYSFSRQLANGLDGNRDHIKLESPEVTAVHKEFNKYSPEVIIDAHEYSVYSSAFRQVGEAGALKYHDVLIQSGRNLNIPERIRTMSDRLFQEPVLSDLESKGISGDTYYTSGLNEEGEIQITEGSTEPRIGRNAFGLAPSFSFLVESRGIGIGREDFARRVHAQIATHEKILTQTADHARQIKYLVASERMNLVKKGLLPNDNDPIIIDSENKELSDQTLEMVDIATGTIEDIPVNYFSSTDAEPTVVRERPTAYLLMPDQKEIAEKLKNQGLKGFTLPKDVSLPAESYTVTKKEDRGEYEDRQLVDVETKVSKGETTFPKGSYVFLTAQPQTNLLSLSLEPESVDSYVSFSYVPSEVDQELPIYRFTIDPKKSDMKNYLNRQ